MFLSQCSGGRKGKKQLCLRTTGELNDEERSEFCVQGERETGLRIIIESQFFGMNCELLRTLARDQSAVDKTDNHNAKKSSSPSPPPPPPSPYCLANYFERNSETALRGTLSDSAFGPL